jgi:hypothetical protein
MEQKRNENQSFIDWYKDQLKKNPIRTKMITSSIISTTADLVSQKLIQQLSWSPFRSFKFSTYGALLAFIFHNWYSILDALFPNTQKSKLELFKRLIVDQLFFAPITTSLFFSYMSMMDGQSNEIPNRLKLNVFPTLKMHWRLWPFAQLINFNYIPPSYRVLFGNLVSFFWTIFLSYRTSKLNVKN